MSKQYGTPNDAQWNAGYDAFRRGAVINDCPYTGVNVDTPEYTAWCDGWNDAKLDWEDR